MTKEEIVEAINLYSNWCTTKESEENHLYTAKEVETNIRGNERVQVANELYRIIHGTKETGRAVDKILNLIQPWTL